MPKYKCGHKGETVLLDNNLCAFNAYCDWKDGVGYNGNRNLCWKCYCKQRDSI